MCQGVVCVLLGYDKVLCFGGFVLIKIISGVVVVFLLLELVIQSDFKGSFVYVVGLQNKVVWCDVIVGDVIDVGVMVLLGLIGQEVVVVSVGVFLNFGELIIFQCVKLIGQ